MKRLGSFRLAAAAVLIAATATLAACGSTGGGTWGGTGATTAARSGNGVVESVQLVDRDDPSLLGTIGGGLVGGLLGHQIGGGSGQTAATIAGAVGGAYAGQQIERRSRGGDQVYRITVRMNDGSYQTIAQAYDPGLRPGDPVSVEGGVVYRR